MAYVPDITLRCTDCGAVIGEDAPPPVNSASGFLCRACAGLPPLEEAPAPDDGFDLPQGGTEPAAWSEGDDPDATTSPDHTGDPDAGCEDADPDAPPQFAGARPQTLDEDPWIGAMVGDYEVVREIGQGGSGVVFLARDVKLDREVALKAVTVPDTEARLRLVRDARTTAGLNHPSLLQVYQVAEQDGRLYIVTEYMDRGTLADWLATHGPAKPADAAMVVAAAARGAAFAHKRGITHRDIKPGNIFLAAGGLVKLGDFGLARTLDETRRLSRSAMTAGSLQYLAPEVCRGEPAGPSADIYALGCVLYQLLTAQPPVVGRTMPEILRAKMAGPLADVRGVRPELPAELADIVQRATDPDPAKRPASADHLADALKTVAVVLKAASKAANRSAGRSGDGIDAPPEHAFDPAAIPPSSASRTIPVPPPADRSASRAVPALSSGAGPGSASRTVPTLPAPKSGSRAVPAAPGSGSGSRSVPVPAPSRSGSRLPAPPPPEAPAEAPAARTAPSRRPGVGGSSKDVRLGPAPTVPPPPPPADDVEDKTLDSDAAAPALGSGSGSRSATDAPVRSAPPGYEILGELGRGGMGVVFRARDQRLGRTVALKMILAGSYAGGEDQARFRLEAEAVAGLQHPNIVQIFEIGSHQGLPFLSLEYCGGGSLAARMAGKPLPARQAAQIAEVVARAAAAAHATGIIHRDIKPGNVLLTETGTPKLTDFGLAKRVDSAGPTATGSALGTPSYMAPEQVDGARNLGPPADVHAIGATLYEMLTGRPPYAGESEVHTIWMVMSQDPVPVRRLQPKAPVDLETICLKCLQKDPRRRYRTAAELADDLRRFLAGQPITARPVGSMELASRWCRRNPAAAGLAAMLVAAVTAGLAGVTWKWREADGLRIVAEVERRDAERSRDQAETARAEAVRSRDDARDNYERAERHRADAERAYIALERERDAAETARAEAVKQREAARSAHAAARAAVDESFTLVSESKLLKMPGLQPLRKELLTAALKYYSKFAEDRAEDPASTAERAAALGRLAIITREIGDPAESLRLLDDQIKAMTPAAGGRIEPDAAAALASAHSNRGVVLSAMGRHEEAVSALRMAVDLQEKVVRARPGELNRLSELAAYLGNLGYHLNFTFQNAEALRTLQRAVKICEEMAAAKPDDPETQNGLAGALTNLATTQLTLGRRDQGRILLERVRTLYEALAAKAPGDAEIAENLARTFANLAATRDQTPEGDEAAVADLKRSIEIRERLARENPAVLEHRARVGYGLVGLASQLRNLKRADEAAGMLERALELYTRLVAEAGTVSDYHAGRAMALNYLGEIRNEAGRAEDGDKLRAEARQILERLVRDVPGDPGYSSLLGVMWLIDARVHEKAGRISEALASVALAIERAKVAAGKSPATATFRSNLAQSHIVRAGLLRGRGDHAAAAASLADARAAGADGGEVRFQIAGEYARLSKAVGAAPEAALHADLAMDLLREAVAKDVRDPARFADQALDPLRDRADFKLLVGGLKPPVM